MTKLNCCSTSCLNNKQGVCTSSSVNLSNEENSQNIYCNSYGKCNNLRKSLDMLNNMNFINGIQEYNNISSHITSVNCAANDCIYNKNGYCLEEKINLKDDEAINKTYCNNYLKAY